MVQLFLSPVLHPSPLHECSSGTIDHCTTRHVHPLQVQDLKISQLFEFVLGLHSKKEEDVGLGKVSVRIS